MGGIILALTLTLVGSQHLSYEPAFDDSKTYVYNYEGVILSGLPEKNLARAGLRIHSRVEISGGAQRSCILQIRDPHIEEFNGIWLKDAFTQSPKLTRVLAEDLTKRIKFEYNNGRIGHIEAPADMSETAVNIIRGILNMLQITIKKSQNVYEIQEAGLGGICQTNYVIQEDKRTNQITVSKSRDLDNCHEKKMKNIGMSYLQVLSTRQQQEKNMRGAAAYIYMIKPKANGALIDKVTVREQHEFTPFNELDDAAVTEARQKLVLVDIRNTPLALPQIQLQSRGTLQYQFATETLQIPIQLIRTKNPEQEIENILQHLVQNQQTSGSDTPAKFLQLVQILRMITHENVEAIWKQHVRRTEYRCWLLDAVPAMATPAALKFMKQRIQNHEISHIEAVQALITTMQTVKTDRQALETAAELVSSERIQKVPILRKTVFLAYGSMVYRYCFPMDSCPETALQPLHDLAVEAVSKAHEEDMVLALKSIGNAGQPASVKRIQKFIPGFAPGATDLPVRVQVAAVMALRNMAKKEPRKVQEIALQIFLNCKLQPEVRMLACVALFESKPSIALVASAANALLKETSLQVASFAYSHMKALTRSTAPDLKEVAAACNVAINLLNPKLDRLSYRYSRALHADGFRSKWMAGAAVDFFVINSAASILPSSVVSKIRGYAVGATADILEVGVRAKGLQDVLLKSRESFSGIPSKKKIEDILKKLANWKALPADKPLISAYFKLFGQEIGFAEINKEYIQEAFQFGTAPSEKHSKVSKYVRQLQNGIAAQWSKPLLMAEARRILPTCVGLPMELSLYSAAVSAATINADAQISPPPSADFRLTHLLNANIRLRAQVTPSVDIHNIVVMGVNTQLIQTGIEVHGKVCMTTPLKFTAKIDMPERSLKLETAPSQQETEMVVLRGEVFAVTRNIEELSSARKSLVLSASATNIMRQHFRSAEKASQARLSSEMMSLEDPYSAEQASRHMAASSADHYACAKAKTFGFELCFLAKTKNAAFIRNSPLYRVFGEHEAKVILKPDHSSIAIDKIQIEIQTGARAVSKLFRGMETDEMNEDSGEAQGKMVLLQLSLQDLGKNGTKTHRSSSSSSSSSSSFSSRKHSKKFSSSSNQEPGITREKTDGIENLRARKRHQSRSSSSSSSITRSKSSSSATLSQRNSEPRLSNEETRKMQPQRENARHSNMDKEAWSHKQRSKGGRSSSSSSSSSNKSSRSSSSSRRSSRRSSSRSSSSKSSSASRASRYNSERKHHKGSSSLSRSASSSQSNSRAGSKVKISLGKSHERIQYNLYKQGNEVRSSFNILSKDLINLKKKKKKKKNLRIYFQKLILHFRSSRRTSSKSSSESSESSESDNDMSKQVGFLIDYHLKNSYSISHSSEYDMELAVKKKITISVLNNPKFPEGSTPPVLAIVTRAVRSDGKQQGYQIAAYANFRSSKPRVQVLAMELAKSDRWRVRVDGILLSPHKAMGIIKWGEEGKNYKVVVKAQTGQFAAHPAVQVKVDWTDVPRTVKETVRAADKYLPGAAYLAGFSEKWRRNPSHQVAVILASASSRTIDIVVKLPQMTLYRQAIPVPLPLPGRTIQYPTSQVQPLGWNLITELPKLLTDEATTQCTVEQNTIKTFNNVTFDYSMLGDCEHILVEDCINMSFLVMIKKAEVSSGDKQLNIKIADFEVVMYPSEGSIKLQIDGTEIPISSLPYTDPSGKVTIKKTENGNAIILSAESLGINSIYFDDKKCKIEVSEFLRGTVCGICGRADGERTQEFQMPDGCVAKESVSFVQSWVVPGSSCSGACQLQHDYVKLEKQVRLHGENSKCYSVDTVLRCRRGCSPVATTPVTVGLHCVPADTTMKWTEGQMNFDQKSEDITDMVLAHTACSCSDTS
uniref:Vitellogenin 5 n=1 Tax=Latimeria chalumnae TaxID=7897 RepID=H3B5Y1_LATCH